MMAKKENPSLDSQSWNGRTSFGSLGTLLKFSRSGGSSVSSRVLRRKRSQNNEQQQPNEQNGRNNSVGTTDEISSTSDLGGNELTTFASSVEGQHHANEDRYFAMENLGAEYLATMNGGKDTDDVKIESGPDLAQFWSTTSSFAVIDGHDGSTCAQFIKDNLPRMMVTTEASRQTECSTLQRLEAILGEAIARVEREFEIIANQNNDNSGACLAIALYHGDSLVVANVGDCLGVLYDGTKKVHYMSKLHRAIIAEERTRVEAAGGFIIKGRVFGQMVPSRTVGDFDIKNACPGAVIAEPYFCHFEVKKRKESLPLLLLASDGLWDIYDGKSACRAARKYLKAYQAKSLVSVPTMKMCTNAVSGGTRDDVTTVLVKL